jgi:PEP-CTERM motif
LTALPLVMTSTAHAQVTGFSNGLSTSTVGFSDANVARGGYYRGMRLTPTGGSAPVSVGYEVGLAYSVNGGVWNILPGSNGLTPTVSGSQLLSNGVLTGANGAVNWTATTQWVGSSLQTSYGFTSALPVGDLRFAHYVDNDVVGVSDDILVVKGSTAGGDLDLSTYDDNLDIGLGTLPDLAGNNMTYLGWSAGTYSAGLNSGTVGRLNDSSAGGLATFSLAGSVTGLSPISDLRFPGLPVYGTADVIIGQFYGCNPALETCGFTAKTTGLPNLSQPSGGGVAPEPGTLALLGLGGVAVLLKRRRK